MILAFGKHVSEEFRVRVMEICHQLGIDPNWLMACIAFESAETFSASIRNAAGSGAVGLIQFMPSTAMVMGTTIEELAAMSPEQQLGSVYQYFKWRSGRIHSLEDLYMCILWPSGIGKPLDYVLFDKNDPNHPARYIQNRGLDWNHDGKITKQEASHAVREKLVKGLSEEHALEI